jgi:hypothetical protein
LRIVFLLKLTPVEELDLMLNGVAEEEAGWNFEALGWWCRIILGLPSMLLCGDKLEFPEDLKKTMGRVTYSSNTKVTTIQAVTTDVAQRTMF